MAAWTNSYDGSTFAINVSSLPFGGDWSQPIAFVLQNQLAYSFGVGISSDDLVMAGMYYDNNSNALQLVSSITSTGKNNVYFTFPVNVTSSNAIGYPVLDATEITGNLYAVTLWVYNDGANNLIQATTGTFNELSPPSNLSVTGNVKDYGVVQEYYNVLTWDPSPSIQTVGYRIFRNNSLLTELVAQTLQFTDYNQVPGSSPTYSLSAIDYAGIQSPSITAQGP